jgi:hypothetical protein
MRAAVIIATGFVRLEAAAGACALHGDFLRLIRP